MFEVVYHDLTTNKEEVYCDLEAETIQEAAYYAWRANLHQSGGYYYAVRKEAK